MNCTCILGHWQSTHVEEQRSTNKRKKKEDRRKAEIEREESEWRSTPTGVGDIRTHQLDIRIILSCKHKYESVFLKSWQFLLLGYVALSSVAVPVHFAPEISKIAKEPATYNEDFLQLYSLCYLINMHLNASVLGCASSFIVACY